MRGSILLIYFICNIFFIVINSDSYKYVTKYITLPVDHFSFSNNESFKLRYIVNDTYWKNSGPIFFYTGNEGDIELFIENTGFMWEIAPSFGALIVFAEHRYYGQSMPYGNQSFSNPKNRGYLTSMQALADFVDVIYNLQVDEKTKKYHHYPVIAFGGSYGGMLAAWLRIKYPHIVAGAIASSAPILQFSGITKCDIFNRVLTSNFKITPRCAENIRKSWNAIRQETSTTPGKVWLSTEWKLCKQLKTSEDINKLIEWLTDVYTNLAMVNYPYASSFLAPLPAYPVNAFCHYMKSANTSNRPLLQTLRKSLNIYTNFTGSTKCIDIAQVATPALGEKGWDYQACTEMVMPICSDGVNDMFENVPWNFTDYSNKCFKKWAVKPMKNLAVLQYGGKEISAASNIVFSNGLLDPWSSGGVTYNASPSITAILIPEGAHHLDLRAANVADPKSVVRARKFHENRIHKWIKYHHMKYLVY